MSAREAWAVVDLGFGDGGKGTLTDFLVRDRGAGLVVRFNGGAQAGHNVVCPDGRHHTFAQFCAGSFVPGVLGLLGPEFLLHPLGMAVDSAGFIWAVNQNTSSASKLDPNTYEVVLEHPVGSSPYTYSDMTGYALKTITTDQGFYRQVFQGWPGSETLWDSLVVEAELPGDGAAWLKVWLMCRGQ